MSKNILCTYDNKNNKVIVLKKDVDSYMNWDEDFQYSISKKQVYFCSRTNRTEDITFVKVKGKKVVKYKTFSIDAKGDGSVGWVYTHYINGKKVSQKSYNKKLKKSLKGFKTVR